MNYYHSSKQSMLFGIIFIGVLIFPFIVSLILAILQLKTQLSMR